MKFSLSAFKKFFVSPAVLFLLASVFAVEINAQQTNKNSAQNSARPKAILVAEWSEPDQDLRGEVLPVRSLVRARIASNAKYVPAAAPARNAAATVAVHAKSSERFAHLQPTELEQQAFDLINEQRRQHNLPAVEWDLGMLHVAREHSANMAKHNFFSHTGIDGNNADDRADNAGIKDWRMIGENIAFNHRVKDKSGFAVECWMRSPKHKENLLGKKWTRSGVGVALTADGKFYITQVFRN